MCFFSRQRRRLEARRSGRARDVRRLRRQPLQLPLGVRQVRLRRLPRLLRRQEERRRQSLGWRKWWILVR